jgi:hypothetical protein
LWTTGVDMLAWLRAGEVKRRPATASNDNGHPD